MSAFSQNEVTVLVPMNIALVKYWGKRNEQLVLPLNDSISLTVDRLTAETTVRMVQGNNHHMVTINGEPVALESNQRYTAVFNEAIRFLRKRHHEEHGNAAPLSVHFEVTSTTNFPVGAGLASSAAGFAAIALGIQQLLRLDNTQTNHLARIGSGSACRSMYGGLVQWEKGVEEDGSDCMAKTIGSSSWPDLYCVILVFDENRKQIGSTEGMRRTTITSPLLHYRITEVVPRRVEQCITAFNTKDFPSLAEVIMADSNQFHALCLDTTPPIRYLNETSWFLMDTVHILNKPRARAAYTFDAGPNACVVVEKKNIPDLIKALQEGFSFPAGDVEAIEAELGVPLKVHSNPKYNCLKLLISPMGGGPSLTN